MNTEISKECRFKSGIDKCFLPCFYNCCGHCTRNGSKNELKAKSNYEIIKEMDLKDLAEFIQLLQDESICYCCEYKSDCDANAKCDCQEGIEKWLNKRQEK